MAVRGIQKLQAFEDVGYVVSMGHDEPQGSPYHGQVLVYHWRRSKKGRALKQAVVASHPPSELVVAEDAGPLPDEVNPYIG